MDESKIHYINRVTQYLARHALSNFLKKTIGYHKSDIILMKVYFDETLETLNKICIYFWLANDAETGTVITVGEAQYQCDSVKEFQFLKNNLSVDEIKDMIQIELYNRLNYYTPN